MIEQRTTMGTPDGLGQNRVVEAALRVGADGYIDKGTSPEELIDAVRAVLRGETGVWRGAVLRAQGEGTDGGQHDGGADAAAGR